MKEERSIKLFDKISKEYTGPALYAEPNFEYLNRSTRPESEKIRDLLEQWFGNFPSDAQSDLRGRFRSKNNRQHFGAFFELYIYKLLLKLDFNIEIHPHIDNKAEKPDFKVSKNEKELFYLEATLAAPSDAKISVQAIENQVYDVIDRMSSPDFFIGLQVHGAPESPPAGRKIREFLEDKLDKLDPNEVTKRYKKNDFGINWNWKHEDWQITFFPIPKPPKYRGKTGIRSIAVRTNSMHKVTSHEKIRKAIKDKACKYGDFDLPYIIAINVAVDPFSTDDSDIMNALFGDQHDIVSHLRGKVISQETKRKLNGAWYSKKGPQYQGVSAAIIIINLTSWEIAKITPVIWHNPWANYPLDPNLLPLPQMIPNLENNKLTKRGGKESWQLFELHLDWPM